jgi:hypothetical protein
MHLFMWMLPNVELLNQEDGTVLFSARADTRETAIGQIMAHFLGLEKYGWSPQSTRCLEEWLVSSEPVIHESKASVCVSNVKLNQLKQTRRRIRAARAMGTLDSEILAGSGCVQVQG